MMSFIKSIFGGADTAGKTMDLVSDSVRGIGNFIDEQKFTDEERSVALSKAVDSHLRLMEATTNENSKRSVTRRWLAWGISGFVLAWASVAMMFAIFGKDEVVTDIIDVSNAFYLGVTFLAVIGFYFGVQLLRK
jgi:hypothetical protein